VTSITRGMTSENVFLIVHLS